MGVEQYTSQTSWPCVPAQLIGTNIYFIAHRHWSKTARLNRRSGLYVIYITYIYIYIYIYITWILLITHFLFRCIAQRSLYKSRTYNCSVHANLCAFKSRQRLLGGRTRFRPDFRTIWSEIRLQHTILPPESGDGGNKHVVWLTAQGRSAPLSGVKYTCRGVCGRGMLFADMSTTVNCGAWSMTGGLEISPYCFALNDVVCYFSWPKITSFVLRVFNYSVRIVVFSRSPCFFLLSLCDTSFYPPLPNSSHRVLLNCRFALCAVRPRFLFTFPLSAHCVYLRLIVLAIKIQFNMRYIADKTSTTDV
jgi:hypothetical protein